MNFKSAATSDLWTASFMLVNSQMQLIADAEWSGKQVRNANANELMRPNTQLHVLHESLVSIHRC